MSDDTPNALVTTEQAERLPALSDKDEALHPLMRHVLTHREGKTFKRFMAGARIPIMSAKLLAKNRQLWTRVLWPVLINFALLAIMLYVFLTNGGGLFASVWAKPVIAAWYDWLLSGLWYVTYLLALALSGFLAYVSSMVIGGVLASPFNDLISEETERILLGDRYQEPTNPEPFVAGVIRSAGSSAVTAALYLMCMGPLLLLNLVPGLGSIAYTVIGGAVGGFFLALEYSDILLARRRYPLKEKLKIVYRDRKFTIGFGVGTSLTLAIPLVNFLCIPLAVIGGTAVGLGLEQWDMHALPDGEAAHDPKLLAAQTEDAPTPEASPPGSPS